MINFNDLEPTKPKSYTPTLEDLVRFTTSFETFSPTVYTLDKQDKSAKQELAGYGSTNPQILQLAREGKLTEEIARNEVRDRLQSELDLWSKLVPNFKNLSIGQKLALADTSYNGKGVEGTIKSSPNLMKLINSGVTDPAKISQQLDHSKSAKGWLGVRSAARRAMAQDKYDWEWKTVDKYGRQVDPSLYKGPEDWRSSPYFEKYTKGGLLKRRGTFEEWYQTVPENKRDTTSYNLRRAFELAPKKQLKSFVEDPNSHLYSAYFNKDTGEYEFMKSKDHPTIQLELD